MRFWRTRSLRARLILRLVIVQGLAVILAGTLGVVTVVLLYDAGRDVPDPRDTEIVAHALERTGDGSLVLRDTDELRALFAAAPDLWLVAADGEGGRLVHGTIPAVYLEMTERIERFEGSSMRTLPGDQDLGASLRVFELDGGRVHVMVGNGRTLDIFRAAFHATNRFLTLLFAILAVATTAVIPWIIRREFRAVEEVAAQANLLDSNQRGIKLSAQGLPSEIEPLVKAFNAALERIDKGYVRQQRFLAAAAHELKTPIAVLQTRIETALKGVERDQLLLDVARLTTLAEQLLDVQRLDYRPRGDAVTDLVALAQGVVADLAPLAIAGGYEIAFESVPDRFEVRADAAAIERVLTNLVQNAIAHGGGKGEIRVTVAADGALEVEDGGPGVPDAHKEEIFEPFHRVQPSSRGSGLGLSLVSDIMRLYGGRVSVADGAGGGSVFTIRLPRALASEAGAPPADRA